jgi:hypothetical protein
MAVTMMPAMKNSHDAIPVSRESPNPSCRYDTMPPLDGKRALSLEIA